MINIDERPAWADKIKPETLKNIIIIEKELDRITSGIWDLTKIIESNKNQQCIDWLKENQSKFDNMISHLYVAQERLHDIDDFETQKGSLDDEWNEWDFKDLTIQAEHSVREASRILYEMKRSLENSLNFESIHDAFCEKAKDLRRKTIRLSANSAVRRNRLGK